jgi:GH24 family phage-related lysozyme (muramidase)
MIDSVRNELGAFSTQFEGRVEYMYVDVKNLVTIGVGNLIDPIGTALPLPFVHKADPSSPASAAEVTSDWNAVKGDQTPGAVNPLAAAGHLACAPLTNLMLTDDAIDALVLARADQNVTVLTQTSEFADLQGWPADAQLALLSLSWAMGPAFGPGWPALRAACAARDWTTAAAACHMDDSNNPGLVSRNVADRVLFTNAAYVVDQGLDPASLTYVVAGERSTLRPGASGGDLDFLQSRLTVLGYLATISGSYDADTADAVRRFQTDQHLTADLVVGPGTWAATGTCVPAA